MSREPTPRRSNRLVEGLLSVLAVAFGVHVADAWLHPVLPTLAVLTALAVLARFLFRGRR